ncbi:hypothetical protein ACIRVF_27725 [Kitasatospora sp. NPDC101157]|uniref:hypothetical protein n=1 Tax=Kitasatospora sp. NPDC101157 TaxID=3364098 RepID=UPI0037F94B17
MAGAVARVRAIRQLLSSGLTVDDLVSRAHRFDLLAEDPPRRCCAADSGPETFAPVVSARLAALDAEIARLTALRNELARLAATGDADGPGED